MPQSERTTGASIQLRGVTKRYSHDGRPAVGDVSLDVAPGEFVTLLGPSGSGKSTTLNMIVGFTDPSEGEILVDGRAINDVPPHKRDLGMVFQDYALFPHMTAAQNIEFPLRYRKVPKAERQRRVDEALEFVELPGYGGRLPRDLSGGERQRVAIARAIVARPVALLMDEPLGALDKKLRESLQVEIRHLHQELGITFVYVTHDQDEALALSDRIAVFNRGRIEQIADPETLYERPSTLFVAEFVGESNTFEGIVRGDSGAIRLECENRSLGVPAGSSLRSGDAAALVVRPEHVRIRERRESDEGNVLTGWIDQILYLGSTRSIEVMLDDGGAMMIREPAGQWSDAEPGNTVTVSWDLEASILLPGDSARGAEAASQ